MDYRRMAEECRQDMERIEEKLARLRAQNRGIDTDAQICMLEDMLTELRLKIKMCRQRLQEDV